MRKILRWYSGLNISLKLLPLLMLYLVLIKLWVLPAELCGDEGRYLWFAKNLLNGFYSPPYPDINLWNGPGYPLFIAPFVYLKAPFVAIRMINGVLLYCSLIYSYKSIRIYCEDNVAFLLTLLLGLYFPAYQMLRVMITETLAWFIISVFCFYFIKFIKHADTSWKYLFLSAFAMAYLAMVKVIFGYVIVVMVLLSATLWFLPKFRPIATKAMFVFCLSFILCLPYLFYTYNLTNKPFYWTNSGSMSLYTMSSPYTEELGDWFSSKELRENPNHKDFMAEIDTLPPLERDQAFKKTAIENIKNNPGKYLRNYIANIGRLLFEYPFSSQKDDANRLFYIIPAMFFIVPISIALFVSILKFRLIPPELMFLLLCFLTYLFGSTLVSAYSRMFNITLPFWALYLSFVYTKILYVRFRQV